MSSGGLYGIIVFGLRFILYWLVSVIKISLDMLVIIKILDIFEY